MAQPHTQNLLTARRVKQRLLLLVILLLGLYVVLPHVGSLSNSWHTLAKAQPFYVALGLLCMAGTYPVAAVTYAALARHRVPWGQTVLVQLSGAFVNRLLPAGLGGMTLNVRYLRTQRHRLPEALVVVGANNTLGAVANNFLLIGMMGVGAISWRQLQVPSLAVPGYVLIGAFIVLAANVVLFSQVRGVIMNALVSVGHVLRGYRRQPWRLVLALSSSLVVTLLHVALLWSAAHALDVLLPFDAYVVVCSVGTLIGAATPTPGGLVGVEAGITAGLIAYGIDPGHALATALLYRLLNYWLPLVPGCLTFLAIRRSLRL